MKVTQINYSDSVSGCIGACGTSGSVTQRNKSQGELKVLLWLLVVFPPSITC